MRLRQARTALFDISWNGRIDQPAPKVAMAVFRNGYLAISGSQVTET
jgi:hypothetical protein